MLGLHFTPAYVLLLVCSLHFTHSLHFTPGPQSAVRSPQSTFYTDRGINRRDECFGLSLVYCLRRFLPSIRSD